MLAPISEVSGHNTMSKMNAGPIKVPMEKRVITEIFMENVLMVGKQIMNSISAQTLLEAQIKLINHWTREREIT